MIEDRSSTTAWRHFYPAPTSAHLIGVVFTGLGLAMAIGEAILSPVPPRSLLLSLWVVAFVLQLVGFYTARHPGPVIWIGSTGLWYPGGLSRRFLPAETMERVLWGGDNLTIKLRDGTNATIPTLLLSSADQLELRKCVERLIIERRPLAASSASA